MVNDKDWIEEEINDFINILEEDIDFIDEHDFLEVLNSQINNFKERINGNMKDLDQDEYWDCDNCGNENKLSMKFCDNCGELKE